ncbi:hypothetical protein DSM104440_00267 [Usitatibacter palustris]|uniref:Uncharacterized protein n=1 Tax=Usitatibacter palustris TaxID=2732487 RepID=A0A6M4H449_9PROT|nr:hypothetical protein DSM104440_00267 [Usitatibacter palustris]
MRTSGERFRELVLCALLGVGHGVHAQETQDVKFLSWYDGWGTHEIWGGGKINASYSGASVKCGSLRVSVTPIYDTHADGQPPTKSQTSDFAKVHNSKVLEQLRSRGLKCDFSKKGSAK